MRKYTKRMRPAERATKGFSFATAEAACPQGIRIAERLAVARRELDGVSESSEGRSGRLSEHGAAHERYGRAAVGQELVVKLAPRLTAAAVPRPVFP